VVEPSGKPAVPARGPRALSGAVARLRQRSTPPTTLAKVQACWTQAVGTSVSEQASPTSESDGVVTVSCRSAVWSAELSMLSGTLLRQLNEALPEDARARGLRFVTRPS
jgi:predicted nucleic acid-binding Zn ribbon protein